jgi:hypothetical protein
MNVLHVAILDDAPYVAWEGRVHAVNATFHRFAAALLDVRDPGGAAVVASIVLAAPVRPAQAAPVTLPVDPRIRVVATEPFDGIAGYLRHPPRMAVRNLPRLRAAFAGADVVLLRLPASNGLLGAFIAMARGIPRVAYVVGSVADVVAGQKRRGAAGLAARAVGAGYDLATRLAGTGATRVTVGARLTGDGIVSSLVLPSELRLAHDGAWPAQPGTIRVAYAGRLAAGKGLEDLVDAVALSGPADRSELRLDLIGDGPEAGALAARATDLGVGHRVRFLGYVAERERYLDELAAADVFISPSPAEGFPKAVLDGMAAGLPVIAVPAGGLADLAAPGATHLGAAIHPVRAGDPGALAQAVRHLAADPARAARLRAAGMAFATAHTLPAEAARLAETLRHAAARGRTRDVR